VSPAGPTAGAAEELLRRPAGGGWLVLVGGGEFSFGDTVEADAAWLELVGDGHVGFVPAASGSVDYGHHFADYLEEEFQRVCETVPIYRARDARRGKNVERLKEAAALYLGGGVADHLLEALEDSPAAAALLDHLRDGGVVVAIAGAAQALGRWVRSIRVGEHLPGLGWLPGGVVEPNFDPAHDRRLRRALEQPGVTWGLGLPAGSAVLLGPEGEVEVIGTVYVADADGVLQALGEQGEDGDDGEIGEDGEDAG
jgi:cyanophycinase-like exopeptidase